MKIVQLFDSTLPQISDYSMRSRYITDSLKLIGYNLKVFSSPSYLFEKDIEYFNGIRYFHISSKWVLKAQRIPILREFIVIITIFRTVDKQWDKDIAIIDAHSSVLNGLAAMLLKIKRKVPFVYEIRAFWEDAAVDLGKTNEHSVRYFWTRAIETFVVKRADKITVICNGLKEDLVKRGVEEKKIYVIQNGVDVDKFVPRQKDIQLIERYNLGNVQVVGFIGTFFKFEGLPLLINAMEIFIKSNKQIKLLLVGGGMDEDNVKIMIKNKGLENHVILTGRVDHKDINKYYSIIDVMVYPRISKRITELVTPLKPLEAMALGKCVVASDVGGLKELILNKKNGILFKTGDVDDLVNICLKVLEDDGLRDTLQKNALEYVKKERRWSDICQGYNDVYGELGVNVCN